MLAIVYLPKVEGVFLLLDFVDVDDVPSQISNTRVLRDYCDDTSWS
jgi:hypothetical protein